MSNELTSLIRRGNHFIGLPEAGWVLIDGPWFDHLNCLSNGNTRHVRLPSISDWPAGTAYPGPCLWIEIKHVEWELIRWHPGICIHPNVLNDCWLADKWSAVLAKRKRWGWRIYPDGCLPAYLNRVEFIADSWQSEQLYRAGY